METTEKSPFGNDEYTVGWLCALPLEFAAAKAMLDEDHGDPQTLPTGADSNAYFLGSMGKFKVVIACLPLHQPGSTPAVATAKEMLFTFPKIRIGLLVGIGAGIPDYDDELDIRLGDVVIGSSPESGGVVVYDLGKIRDGTFESLSVLNRPPKSLGTALGKLQAVHENRSNLVAYYVEEMLKKHPFMRTKYAHPGPSNDRLFQPNYPHIAGARNCNKCDSSQQVEREPRPDEYPIIHYGTIASGNMVVKDALLREELKEKHGAICLEMEAAGLMNNFPCVVIRGISDYGDSHKNDRWQRFAAAAAAGCAKELMQHIQANSVDGEPAAKDLLYQVHEKVHNISSFATTEQTRQVLEWLTSLDFDKNHHDYMKLIEPDTGLWFLNSAEFTQWLSHANKSLLCPGIPGVGKTFISAIVVNHLKVKVQRNPEIQACCIFCSHQPRHEDSNFDLSLSLLRQLAVKNSTLLVNIESMYKRHSEYRTRPTAAEIDAELLRTAGSYEMIYIVVDALDEHHDSSPEDRMLLLEKLFKLQEYAPVNILVTSRPNTEILAAFKNCMIKEIEAQPDDMEKYINRVIPSFRSKITQFPEVQQRVRQEVIHRADGIFLLATLHVQYLKDRPTRGSLKESLMLLPHGKNSLQSAYGNVLTRIKNQDEECVKMARSALAWLAYSRRALFAKELRHALGTRLGKGELDQDDLPASEIIDTLCAGLVVFDQESGIIRLVHYTTKEFLIGHPFLQNAETEITQTAITYLSFGCFSSGRSTKPDQYTHRQKQYPLHHYCAQNWASHALIALSESDQLIDFLFEFLNKESNVFAAGQAMMAHSILGDQKEFFFSNWLDFIPRRLTKVHLVAYGGLSVMISRYIDSNEDMEVGDSEGKTPLAYAAQKGHLVTAKIILESSNVHADGKDNRGATPLLLAASGGHTELVKVLLQYGADPDSRDNYGNSPLCGAAEIGNTDIMKILLDNGASIDYQCASEAIEDGTPLLLAWASDNKDALQLLLDHGADPDFANEGGDTLLSAAARNNDEELVNRLLEKGVRIDPKGNLGSTPLSYAVEGGYISVVKTLLSANADVNTQGSRLENCLMSAIEYGHDDIAALLLQHEIDPNLRNRSSETALFYAVRKSNKGLVDLLLGRGADPNIQDKAGETVLFITSRKGQQAMTDCLLHNGANAFIRNNHEQTALFSAAKNGHLDTVDVFVELGLDIDQQDDVGNTAIFYSVGSGKVDVTRRLLNRGADVHHGNAIEETVMFSAARQGRHEIISILLEYHAELDPLNILMETPLIYAAKGLCHRPSRFGNDGDLNTSDFPKTVKILLENGANPNPECTLNDQRILNSDSWRFLLTSYPTFHNLRQGMGRIGSRENFCQAARQIWDSRLSNCDDSQVLDFLDRAVYGLHPSGLRRDEKGTAPLVYAVRGGHSDLVKMFLTQGLRIDVSFDLVQTVLKQAVTSGHRSILQLILREGPASMTRHVQFPELVLSVAEEGDTELLEFLMTEHKGSLETASKALLVATLKGKVEMANFLLDRGAKPVFVTERSQTTLHAAVMCGDSKLVKRLLEQTPSTPVDTKDKHGRTALFYAVQRRKPEIAQILLEARADPNTSEDECEMPILYDSRCARGKWKDLEMRNQNKDIGGQTPLFFASGDGNDSMVQLLLENHAMPDHQDQFGERPICWAAGQGYEAIVKMLLDKGASANKLKTAFDAPILWALGVHSHSLHQKVTRGRGLGSWDNFAVGDMIAVVDLLLQSGADPNILDDDGKPLIFRLIQLGLNSKSLVRALIRAGCDPNVRDQYGRTPLMGATVHGMGEFVAAILEAPNIDRDAKDIFGRTALMEATARNKKRISILLTESKGNVNDDESPMKIHEREHEILYPTSQDMGLAPLTEGMFERPGEGVMSFAFLAGSMPEDPGLECDICGAPESRQVAYNCKICHNGDFDICEECKKWGATCLDETHKVGKRKEERRLMRSPMTIQRPRPPSDEITSFSVMYDF
ncbi:unnamed protein product [Penicillium viridicatum]